jgi:hypothetical protein
MSDMKHKDSEKPVNGYFSTESHIFIEMELRLFFSKSFNSIPENRESSLKR